MTDDDLSHEEFIALLRNPEVLAEAYHALDRLIAIREGEVVPGDDVPTVH
jgi:hypothetical protein